LKPSRLGFQLARNRCRRLPLHEKRIYALDIERRLPARVHAGGLHFGDPLKLTLAGSFRNPRTPPACRGRLSRRPSTTVDMSIGGKILEAFHRAREPVDPGDNNNVALANAFE